MQSYGYTPLVICYSELIKLRILILKGKFQKWSGFHHSGWLNSYSCWNLQITIFLTCSHDKLSRVRFFAKYWKSQFSANVTKRPFNQMQSDVKVRVTEKSTDYPKTISVAMIVELWWLLINIPLIIIWVYNIINMRLIILKIKCNIYITI